MREISSCEVCGAGNLINALNLGEHPLQDDLVPIGDKRSCQKYALEVLFCDRCKTAHLRWQLDKERLFQPGYTHRSHQTKDVLDGMEDLVNAAELHYGLVKGRKVLDIGCNDGSLLSVFARRGAATFGIEPTEAATEACSKGHTVWQRFFAKSTAEKFLSEFGFPDLITFTNVFAHIEDLPALIEAVRVLLKPDTMVIIENHYLGSVIERQQFDTFFHEHLRTYSYTSFLHMSRTLGMYVSWAMFPKRYGGNIRVFLKHGSHSGYQPFIDKEKDFAFALAGLNRQIKEWKKNKRAQILAETEFHGFIIAPIGAVALPARAPLLISMLGLDHNHISAVYQIDGSKKIGHYVPGTRIPILSDANYPFERSIPDTPLLNMAWHIRDEIEARWRGMGFRGRFIQMISAQDFADAAVA
jgi:2-polyprenyl-3-methyl-5-hydroxy-6-metoxy-1,4-benzoquinol methylase